MLTLNHNAISSSFSTVPFHANYALSTPTQFLFSSNLNYSFATTATRKFKSFQLKAGFWESIKSGYLQFSFFILAMKGKQKGH
ncbi:hypothetical protein ACSQ67_016165 [Phaseolus vulgaris]